MVQYDRSKTQKGTPWRRQLDRLKDTETELVRGQRSQGTAWALPLLTGVSWSLFYTLLHVGNHAPSSLKGVIYLGQSYYAFGAAIVSPLVFLLTFIVVTTVRFTAQLGEVSTIHCWNQIQKPYLLPLLMVLILPEMLTYLFFGFEGVNKVAPYLGGAAALIISFGVYRVTKRLGANTVRAFLATFLAAILQALPAGALLR